MAWESLLEELINPQEESVEQIIMRFLTSRVPESTVLDYKSQVDLTSNKVKRDLSKWVAGLANSSGGILLLGVKEEDNTGRPDLDEEIIPVKIPDGIDLVQHVTNIINGTISPIPVFHPYPFPVGDGEAAIIIIPASNNKPLDRNLLFRWINTIMAI